MHSELLLLLRLRLQFEACCEEVKEPFVQWMRIIHLLPSPFSHLFTSIHGTGGGQRCNSAVRAHYERSESKSISAAGRP